MRQMMLMQSLLSNHHYRVGTINIPTADQPEMERLSLHSGEWRNLPAPITSKQSTGHRIYSPDGNALYISDL